MKKLSENNKIEVVSEAIKVAIGAVILAALLYYLEVTTGAIRTLDITKDDLVMIGSVAVGFCILWVLLDKLFFTPYVRLFEKREKLTVGADDDLKRMESEIAQMQEQYEIKTLSARAEAIREKTEQLTKAKNEANKQVDAAKHVAQEEIAKARKDFADRKAQLKNSALTEAQVLAEQMVSKVLSSKGQF